ncbi:[protein-PII] uridylyltransferase [Persicirhabdus sediminis]|uniref:Bifunctional uridylyltransferase/uridylyl-removing enzyme n=1 Tax=Persicirhabdus sediminis TaxID=454144 RepID=A0A8J7MEH0_9BACT|nr:[protein-PII] uridylyltransferase [Persicirhabdus sediminis]MBK1791038.1 [protein-PII] uridylyltransferase [Persicirhabdus sediminis]
MSEISTNEILPRAEAFLDEVCQPSISKEDRIEKFKAFMQKEEDTIKARHDKGAGGLEVACARADLIDAVLTMMFRAAINSTSKKSSSVALVAQGGYGRGTLNPASDIDLLFLLPKASHKLPAHLSKLVEEVLYLLWDMGCKVGHACRSITECISEARKDQQNKTALMDARMITGNQELYEKFEQRFEKECVVKSHVEFLELRQLDLAGRHAKYSHTVFLQEPHVKESCGGMRDYHNSLWISRVKLGVYSLKELASQKIVTKNTLKEFEEAYDFLHRVRNELHYHNGRCTDILTLQLQGVVANKFKYPQKTILRRCEAFMRDYYRHTRYVYQHTTSLMERFEIEHENRNTLRWASFIKSPTKRRQVVDGFIIRNGRIYPEHKDTFIDDPHRMMKVYQIVQLQKLRFTPEMRKTISENRPLINKSFRYSKANRETFRAILERKGEVAPILRLMHRSHVLDDYLPEFAPLDCLVQHEFFHRYTADEHTLRCIDQLDSLLDEDATPKGDASLYRKLLLKIEDPYALYLALILHDTGRAENVREHIDGSTILADKLCRRLVITGGRRALIMFLVDHHLTFWRYATSRNLDDVAVIEEFANIIRDKRRLDALLLFTWADSNGTNDEAWSPWKESLMLQLYRSTRDFLTQGAEQFSAVAEDERREQEAKCKKILPEGYHEYVDMHFAQMPKRYFRFREPKNIAIHIRSSRRFYLKDKSHPEKFNCDLRWIDRDDRSHTELLVSAWNRPLLIEKICCALASQEINIISADVFTRADGMACDLFKVCTKDLKPVTSEVKRKRVLKTFQEINKDPNPQAGYSPEKYLKVKVNMLQKDISEGGIPFPIYAEVRNDLSPTATAVSIQAKDRIGLLHDLFYHIGKLEMATVHARICTEKGAAMDIVYVTWPDGGKIEDEEDLKRLQEAVDKVIAPQ